MHAQSCPALCNPLTLAHQTPLSVEFSRQEYWNGCHFLFQGIFLTQGSNPGLFGLLHWQADSLPLCHLESPVISLKIRLYNSSNFILNFPNCFSCSSSFAAFSYKFQIQLVCNYIRKKILLGFYIGIVLSL